MVIYIKKNVLVVLIIKRCLEKIREKEDEEEDLKKKKRRKKRYFNWNVEIFKKIYLI